MNEKTVITIGREFGSGGHEIGQKLAADLGIKCYDKEVLAFAAKESGFGEGLFEEHDEKSVNSFLNSLVMGAYPFGYTYPYPDKPIDQKLFTAQSDAIRKLAKEGSCVVIGRCADYVLKDNPYTISAYVKASMDFRIDRVKGLYKLNDADAAAMIKKTDKHRASYYNYYTDQKWGDAKSYDLCFDSGKLGIENSVDLIKKYIEIREKNF